MDHKDNTKLDSNNGGGDGNFIGDDPSSKLPGHDVEEEGAPLPPETIAASFEFDEERKPQLTSDNIIAAQIPGEQYAVASFQGHGDDEHGGLEDEDEDDEQAPPPPEMIAASYESIDYLQKARNPSNNTHAQIPAGHNAAASFQGHGDDEQGEMENDQSDEDEGQAPLPPEMIAALYEQTVEESQLEKARNLTSSIYDDMELGIENSVEDHVDLLHVVFDNDGTHHTKTENPGSRVDSPTSAPAIIRSDPISIVTPTLENVDVLSLPRSDCQVRDLETSMPPTSTEPMPPSRPIFDRSNQSLPLLEATLVQDAPDVPVYDAFPLSDNWTKPLQKYRVIILGLILVATAAITAVAVVVVRSRRLTAAATLATTASPSESPTASPTTTPSMSPSTGIPTKYPLVWKRQGPAIVGDAADDELGTSVAVSADARTIVIGAPGYYEDDSKKGYVKVYRTSDDSGNRAQLGETIYGDKSGDQFGWSVDINADGNTIVIGSPGHYKKNDRPGYVRVFSLEGDLDSGTNSWTQVGNDITGEANGDEFGTSVSISRDGMTIAVGADWNDGENGLDSGHVRIYRMDDSRLEWVQIGEDIEGEAISDWSGYSVSLSADGNRVAIGSPWNDDNGDDSGHVKVYQMDSAGSSWDQLGQTLNGDNAYDLFGRSVDLSPDGNTLAIGSPGNQEDNDRPGYVRVYSLKVGNDNAGTRSWDQIGQDIIGEANSDEFGYSVSLSNDGRAIAVGAWGNDGDNRVDSGHVRVYRTHDSQSDWIQIGDNIDGGAAYDYLGRSVSMSADGNNVAFGSVYNDNNGADAGNVQVYILE
jgi:hypothetical protein